MQLKEPIVVITGVSGFVGKHLAEKALSLGFKVIGLDNTDSLDFTSKIEFHKVDVSKDNFAYCIPNKAVVVHLASISTDIACKENPQLAINVNYSGTLNAINCANIANASHFIFASSEWVYPERTKSVNQIESDRLEIENLNSFYAISKLVGESIVRTQSKIPYTNLRFGIVYGPRITPGSSIESLALKIYNNEEITVGSKLTSRRFIYINDLISGIIACINLDNKFVVNGPLNLAGNSLVSLEEVLRTTNLLLEKNNSMVSEDKPPSVRNPVSAKAEKLLDWVPDTNLSEGIESCLRVMTNLRSI
jgi:nucleoside-diphosphate-sugar epimerase